VAVMMVLVLVVVVMVLVVVVVMMTMTTMITVVREQLQSSLLSSRTRIAGHLLEREKCDAVVGRNGTFCVKYVSVVVFVVLIKSEQTCQHYYATPTFPTSFIILV